MPPPLPCIRDWEHFRSVRFDAGLWGPPVRWVLARHELAGNGPVELVSSVHVVAVGRGRGGQALPPAQRRRDGLVRDRDGGAAAAGRCRAAGAPPARGRAAGRSRVAAAVLRHVGAARAAPGRGGRRPGPVAASLGRILRAMDELRPAGPGPFAADGFLAGRLDACVAEHRAAGRVPARWMDEMPGYLDRARPAVLDGHGGTVLTHGDLHRGNIYAHPGPVLAGVLDFNDVRLTDAYYDLVVVHLRSLDADRRLLQALPDAHGAQVRCSRGNCRDETGRVRGEPRAGEGELTRCHVTRPGTCLARSAARRGGTQFLLCLNSFIS
jgi:hypothetical protein